MVNERDRLVEEVLRRLKRRYRAQMHTSLDHANPWELLVATMLSAQSQDTQVNKVTARLFKDYRTPRDFARLKPGKLYRYIGTLGLYRGKARNIVRTAKMLEKQYYGKVPRSICELVKLPGVGRKTANVVLGSAFHIHEGIAIDTHCITVANRLGIARTRDPALIEEGLMQLVDRKDYGVVSHLFIALGRDVCTARRKYCRDCVLKDICPSSDVIRKGAHPTSRTNRSRM